MHFSTKFAPKLRFLLLVVFFVVFLTSAGYLISKFFLQTPTYPGRARGDGLIISNAVVESLQLLQLESFPVQVNVVASGYLPDPCTQVDEIQKRRQDNTFFITIRSSKPHDAVCTQAVNNFEQVIPLEVAGLKQGTYTVIVNGQTTTFTLHQDNLLTTPQP